MPNHSPEELFINGAQAQPYLLQASPNSQNPDHWYTLGQHQGEQQAWEQAQNSYLQVLSLAPEHWEAYNALGQVYTALGQPSQAKTCFEKVLQALPQHVGASNNLAIWYWQQGQWAAGIDCLEKVWPQAPPDQQAVIQYNLNQAYQNWFKQLHPLGGLVQPWHILARWLQHRPSDHRLFERYLIALLGDPSVSLQQYLNAVQEWNQRYVVPLIPAQVDWPHERNPEKRLRIGYLSPDFCHHSAADGYFPLFFYHDTQAFEVFGYYNFQEEDPVSQQFQRYCEHWLNITDWSDEAVWRKIRADQIDILVDLSGHTWGNRLLVLARRAAPIQLSGLGFSSVTTGVSTIHGRLTHPGLTWQNPAEKKYWLKLLHHWYPPGIQTERPPASPVPPCEWKGYITFGFTNNPIKLNVPLLQVWSQILKAVPRSRLWFKYHGFEHPELQQLCRAIMAEQGLEPERLQFTGGTNTEAQLGHYQHIDIMLDPFPYNGGVTTVDALLQGVPVVACRKGHGWSALILKQAGLEQWIANDAEAYCALAIELAQNPQQLREWRPELPLHVLNSKMVDGLAFTREIEAVYRQVWREWCDGHPELGEGYTTETR